MPELAKSVAYTVLGFVGIGIAILLLGALIEGLLTLVGPLGPILLLVVASVAGATVIVHDVRTNGPHV